MTMSDPVKLTDLSPSFVGAGGEGVSNADGSPVPRRDGIGLLFDCPCQKCGTRAFVYFKNPMDGQPARAGGSPTWQRTGNTFETISLTPSILRTTGCGWHGYLTEGLLKSV